MNCWIASTIQIILTRPEMLSRATNIRFWKPRLTCLTKPARSRCQSKRWPSTNKSTAWLACLNTTRPRYLLPCETPGKMGEIAVVGFDEAFETLDEIANGNCVWYRRPKPVRIRLQVRASHARYHYWKKRLQGTRRISRSHYGLSIRKKRRRSTKSTCKDCWKRAPPPGSMSRTSPALGSRG